MLNCIWTSNAALCALQGSLEQQLLLLRAGREAEMRAHQIQALEATVAKAVLSSITSSVCSAASFLLQHHAALQPLLTIDWSQQRLQPAAAAAAADVDQPCTASAKSEWAADQQNCINDPIPKANQLHASRAQARTACWRLQYAC